MRPAYRPGTRPRLLPPAAVSALVLSGLAAGCSSSPPPAYCTAAANLKTSVSNLGNVDVAKNGLGSVQTALNSVTVTRIGSPRMRSRHSRRRPRHCKTRCPASETAIKSAKSQPSLTAASAVASSVTQVKSRQALCRVPYQDQANAREQAQAGAGQRERGASDECADGQGSAREDTAASSIPGWTG